MPDASPPIDTVEDFAKDLRALRADAGDPTLIALEKRTGISKSVISEAFAGRRLPTEKTVQKLVPAISGDVEQWVERRNELAGVKRPGGNDQNSGQASIENSVNKIVISTEPQSDSGRKVSIAAAVVLTLSAALASAALTSFIWMKSSNTATKPATNQATPTYLDYGDGVDPMQTICRDDAVIAASEQRLDGQVQVQMMYSNQCMGVWGRITRYDGLATGNNLEMRIYPAVNVESDRTQLRDAFDLQSLYTPLLIEPDVEARVCGIATITQNGDPIELGPPLCI